jgi:hypothetical protein
VEEKNKKTESKKKKTFFIETEDVSQEIANVAISKKIPQKMLDFNIINYRTYYKERGKEDKEWIELDKDNLYKLGDDDFLLKKNIKFKQQYNLEFFLKSEAKEFPLDVVLGANKLLTKVVTTIKPNLDMEYYPELEQDLLSEINKRKAKAKVLLGFRDQKMKKEVKSIVSKIRVNGFLEESKTIVVSQGIDPIKSISSKIIWHYKDKFSQEDEFGRIDHSKRGFILAVTAGETVMELIKEREGRAGRNCRGDYIPVNKPVKEDFASVKVTENIEIDENEDRILYIAKIPGYVKEVSQGTFDISEEMEIDKISFKNTGSIETGKDTKVKLNIKEADAQEDAIGSGMNVETTEITVEGSVGSNATITAESVIIGGQTHQSSSINATDAKVAVHRGTINTKTVEIERLEGGCVYAETAFINQVIGGEVYAKEIRIESLNSNAKLTASSLIEIKKIKGVDNKLIIDPSKIGGYGDKISKLNALIAKNSKDLDKMQKEASIKRSSINANKAAAKAIKEKMIEDKKAGRKSSAAFIVKLKEFQASVEEYNAGIKNIQEKEQSIKDLREDLDSLQLEIFNAKVVCESVWTDFNEVMFNLIMPKLELIYKPRLNELSKCLVLKDDGEGGYEIVNKSAK